MNSGDNYLDIHRFSAGEGNPGVALAG